MDPFNTGRGVLQLESGTSVLWGGGAGWYKRCYFSRRKWSNGSHDSIALLTNVSTLPGSISALLCQGRQIREIPSMRKKASKVSLLNEARTDIPGILDTTIWNPRASDDGIRSDALPQDHLVYEVMQFTNSRRCSALNWLNMSFVYVDAERDHDEDCAHDHIYKKSSVWITHLKERVSTKHRWRWWLRYLIGRRAKKTTVNVTFETHDVACGLFRSKSPWSYKHLLVNMVSKLLNNV